MCRYLKYTLQKRFNTFDHRNIVNVLAFETLWFSARAIVKSQGSAPVQDSAGYCTNYCLKTKIEKFYLFNINWSRIPDGPRNGVGDLIMFVYFIIMLHQKTSLSLWNKSEKVTVLQNRPFSPDLASCGIFQDSRSSYLVDRWYMFYKHLA